MVRGASVWHSRIAQRHGHAETLLPSLQALCGEAGVDLAAVALVACVTGPGSFTGLRVGLATAQGLGIALDCAVFGVSAFAALARTVSRVEPAHEAPLLLMLDSRRAEPFVAAGDSAMAAVVATPAWMALPDLVERVQAAGMARLRVAGDAGAAIKMLAEAGIQVCESGVRRPDPADVCALALEMQAAGELAPALPLYLRPPDAAPARAPIVVR